MERQDISEAAGAELLSNAAMAMSEREVAAMQGLKEEMERSERCAPSDVQGWAAQAQALLPVCVMCLAPWGMEDPNGMQTWRFGAARLALLSLAAVWHVLLGNVVLSPLPYAVVALQLALPQPTMPMFVLVLLATAVCQRCLENLIHEASHFTLFESRHLQAPSGSPAKYYLATLFALLVFRDVERYRASHSKHHGSFGDRQVDPDTSNYDSAKVAGSAGVLRAALAWYWENATTALKARPVTLPCLAAGILCTHACATTCWPVVYFRDVCAAWLLAYFVVLPLLRMIAEQEEHSGLIPEGRGDLVRRQWAMSRTNDGWLHRWVFHPCGDGYHAVHHLSPRVPFFRLREVHQELLKTQPIYAKGCQLNTKPFQFADRKSVV